MPIQWFTALALLGATVAARPRTDDAKALGTGLGVTADSCDSIFARSTVGWVEQQYRASLRQWDGDIPFPQTHLMMTLNELGAQLRFEHPLDLTALGTNGSPRGNFDHAPDQNLATFDTQGLYAFMYEPSGRLGGAQVLVSSRSRRLDSAVVRAIYAVNDSGSLLPLPEAIRKSAVELRLTIGSSVFSDSLAITAPLFRVRQPVFHGVTPPLGDKKLTIVPRYADEERHPATDGEVLIQIVVQADGSVDPNSILIPEARTSAFARNVSEAVRKSTFTPGTVAGCPVASLAVWPFKFTIAR